MSFGLEFTNTSGTVVLDSLYSRLCVIASGALAVGAPSTNYFPRPALTQEPPLVFVRINNPGGGAIGRVGGFIPLGSAGNWTGFIVGSGYVGSEGFAPGDWFACQFGAQAVAQFGMRLWDGSGQMIFDSGTPAARFTRSAQNWAFAKNISSETTYNHNYYALDFAFDNTEFQMINQFGINLISNDNVGRSLGSWWDWPSNRLWAVAGAFGNIREFHLPALFAKIQVD